MTVEPTTYDQIRAITKSERAALTAAALLPHLPKTDYLLVVENWFHSESPPRSGFNPDDETERDRFKEYAKPVAPGLNLYRADLWSHVGGDALVWVDTVPHSDHGPYEFHRTDFRAMKRPRDDDFDYEHDQATFGEPEKQVPDKTFERDSHLPI